MKLNTLTKLMKWFSISLACAATSLVGVPTDIDYNGSLADETGALLDGEVQMEFAIGTEDASSVYWTQEASPVMVTQGVFSAVLSGVDSDILGNPDLFLHVWVGETADALEALGAAPLNSVPYAVRAGTVNVEDLDGDIGGIIPEGAIDAEMLGTVLIDVPFIDADGDGVPDDPEAEGARRVSIQDILQSISDNSKLGFEQTSPERTMFEVLLDLDQPIGDVRGWVEGSPASSNRPIGDYDSHYKDPFPISQVYEYNGGLMPKIDILDVDTKEVITGELGNPVPGIAFLWVEEDVEGTAPNVNTWGPFGGPPFTRQDGWTEGRMVVAGTPDMVGDYPVLVRATNAWGQDFVQEYLVQVREIEIESEVYLERQAMGSSTWTTSDADTPFGGDPVRARFDTEDDEILTDNIVVRWEYPNPNSAPGSGDYLTVDIAGEDGKMFYIHSEAGDDSGAAPSMGAQRLDEDPLTAAFRNHTGTYSAQILLDWGQGVEIGSDTIHDVYHGYTWTDNPINYEAPNVNTGGGPGYVAPPATPVPLFNYFLNTTSNTIGMKSSSYYSGQIYGATPAGDEGAPLGDATEDWHLRGVITGGDTEKGLVGDNPFNNIDSGAYIRGSVENRWIQQKRMRVPTTSGSTVVEHSIRLVETVVTDGVDDPRVDIAVDGFGPLDTTDWPLAEGDGVIHDSEEMRAPFDFPEDGGDLTYTGPSPRLRPSGSNDDPLPSTPLNANWNSWLINVPDKMVIYHLYSTNGYTDSFADTSAIVEVGSNINIVNDLVDNAVQVAGYSITVGGDFGTTNGATDSRLQPPEESGSGRTVVWGVNDLAYIWSSSNGYLFDVESANGNVATIGGQNLVNTVTADDSAADFSVMLGLDSGFSLEETSTDINVLSDVVIWDFHLQRINILADPGGDPTLYYYKGAYSSVDESLDDVIGDAIAPGDDVVLTVEAYVRPPLYTDLAEDAGGVTNYGRDLTAEFWLVPYQTNVPVKITANIIKEEDAIGGPGLDPDGDDNHVRSVVEGRMLTRFTVILENPLQDLATTNVATGYIYAVITSRDLDGNWLNTVSTLDGHSQEIAANGVGINDDTENFGGPPVGNEINTIGPDNTLDARVKMPLDPLVGEGIIVVDPNATPFPAPAP